MIRTALLVAALSLSSVAPVITAAHAGSHKNYNYNQCKAKKRDGSKIKFKCEIDERCCYDRLLDRSSCVKKDRVIRGICL